MRNFALIRGKSGDKQWRRALRTLFGHEKAPPLPNWKDVAPWKVS